jgi:hypothetical protein
MRALPLVLVALGAFLVLASCSSAEDLATAEREVEKFHRAYDAGQFGEIYDKATDEFRKDSKQEFVAFMETVQRKLGKITATKRANFNVSYGSGPAKVTLFYETSFADGKGTERFNYLVSGKKALLVGYRLESKDLLLK